MFLRYVRLCLNPLPEDNILALSELKVFEDDNFNVAEMFKFLPEGNIAGKEGKTLGGGGEENTGYQHFPLLPQYFSKGFFFFADPFSLEKGTFITRSACIPIMEIYFPYQSFFNLILCTFCRRHRHYEFYTIF